MNNSQASLASLIARGKDASDDSRRSLRECDSGTPQSSPTEDTGVEMNGYLLDTDVISELRKPSPHGGVVAWINDLQGEQLLLSAVPMEELPGPSNRRHPNARENLLNLGEKLY